MSYTVQPDSSVRLNGVLLVLDKASNTRFQAIVTKLWPIIDANSRRTGVPAATIAAIIWSETGFLGPTNGATAVSPAGAIGRMQLMPFWFDKPTQIGDGKAHTREEMFNDALNIRFGTDLLKIIQSDGNDLPQIASIYNCGSSSPKHPWRPHPSPPYKGQADWGYCGEGTYVSNVVAASNSFRLATRPSPANASGGSWVSGNTKLVAVAVGVGAYVALRRLLR